jgi:hypothetical protein
MRPFDLVAARHPVRLDVIFGAPDVRILGPRPDNEYLGDKLGRFDGMRLSGPREEDDYSVSCAAVSNSRPAQQAREGLFRRQIATDACGSRTSDELLVIKKLKTGLSDQLSQGSGKRTAADADANDAEGRPRRLRPGRLGDGTIRSSADE